MTYQELQSKSIDFLRFPLIIGVIFIHNYSSTMIVQGTEIGSDSFMPVFHLCSELFSQVIGRVAVPIFFLFSGFLFFMNVDFNRQTYKRKLKSRFKSLLIPYLFWNTAFLLFYYAASHLPVLQSWFKGTEYTPGFILSSLWGRIGENSPMTYPIAYQFWFIRDLMMTVLLSPLIYWIARYTKWYGLGVFAFLWYLEIWPDALQYHGLNITAWFFFFAGACLSIHKKNLVETFQQAALPAYLLYPLLAILDVYTKGQSCNHYIHNAGILLGMIFFLNLTAHFLSKGCWKTNEFLSKASFFVFAIHDPWLLSQFRKIIFKTLHPESDGLLTFTYFLTPALVTLAALGIYILLKRLSPSFLKVITGR